MPDHLRRVIVNATPIIALSVIGKLDLLNRLYGVVYIPPKVYEEVLAGGPGGIGRNELKNAKWIRVMPLQDSVRAHLLSDLDPGEAEVIALALEVGSELVVIDELLARRHAKRIGLTLTGTIGILIKAKQTGGSQQSAHY